MTASHLPSVTADICASSDDSGSNLGYVVKASCKVCTGEIGAPLD